MKGALITSLDGTVLARWEDAAAIAFPVAPDGCQYVDIDDSQFDALSERYRPDGHLAFVYNNGLIVPRQKPGTRKFYAICNSSTRAVRSLDRDIPSVLPPGFETVPISQADYSMIADSPFIEDGPVSAWDCAVDGTVTARADTRNVLRVSFTGQAVVGSPFTIDFQVEDDQGSALNFTGQRPLGIVFNGVERKVDFSVTNGASSVQRTFNEPGVLVFKSALPTQYRVAGDTTLEIVESW